MATIRRWEIRRWCRWQGLLLLVLYEDSVSEDVGIIEAHVVVLPNELLVAGGRRCWWVSSVIEGNDEYRLRTHTTHTHTHHHTAHTKKM
jgi:hypothetical protein